MYNDGTKSPIKEYLCDCRKKISVKRIKKIIRNNWMCFFFKPKCYKFNLIPSCFLFVSLLQHSLNRSQNLIFYLQWRWKNQFCIKKDLWILWFFSAKALHGIFSKINMIFKCFNYIFKFDMLINKELVNKFPKYFCIKMFLFS